MKNDDLDGLLHAEIERLPERYRAPVVLCDLEGCSHLQAARHLGWPVGTVKSRQARGREKLRDRLRRQGVVPNVALLGSGSLSMGPNAVVPSVLVESTIRSVVQFVTCQSIVPASTLVLARGVLNSMTMTRRLKAVSILLATRRDRLRCRPPCTRASTCRLTAPQWRNHPKSSRRTDHIPREAGAVSAHLCRDRSPRIVTQS